VLPAAQIANLPAGRVVVIRRGIPPVIGRAQMAWHRRDVHAHLHPDALTVRARAALQQARKATIAWLAAVVRPAAAAIARGWGQLAGWTVALARPICRRCAGPLTRITSRRRGTGQVLSRVPGGIARQVDRDDAGTEPKPTPVAAGPVNPPTNGHAPWLADRHGNGHGAGPGPWQQP
jgi:hypothetical protein